MFVVDNNVVQKQKGLKKILQERNLLLYNMKKEDMTALQKQQPDFKDQKGWLLEETCMKANHLRIFFPKFHPEFNWIERYWGAIKQLTRHDCNYSFSTQTVPQALDSIPLSKMRKFARKSYRYMDVYRERNGVTLLCLRKMQNGWLRNINLIAASRRSLT
jgi:hypothetical protein